jgi:hypothetical protein
MPTSSLLKQLISSSMMAGFTIFGVQDLSLAIARPANAGSLVRDDRSVEC